MKLEKINTKEAFRYLGYGSSMPDRQILEIAGKCEKELLSVIDGKYVYRYFDIDRTDERGVILDGTDFVMEGNSIREHLSGCGGVIMMAVTLSEGVDRLIRRMQVGTMSAAVITDAMASAAVEQLCELVEVQIKKEITAASGNEKYFTWRFSPGYGDFPLEAQSEFLNILNTGKRIGVNITEGGLMAPCKSVTAVIGVSDTLIEKKRRGCADCLMQDKCAFRKRGEHCDI